MSCGNSIKNKCMKSCERFYNNSIQSLAANQTLQLQIEGARVVDTGVSIDAEPMSYTTLTKGLYHISGDAVITATTSGTATFSIYMDGVQLPCTVKNINIPDGSFAVHTETDLYLDNCCCNVSHTFTYVIQSTGLVGTVSNLCTGVIKEA